MPQEKEFDKDELVAELQSVPKLKAQLEHLADQFLGDGCLDIEICEFICILAGRV